MIGRFCINKIPTYKGRCDSCQRWMTGSGEEPDDVLNAMKANGWKVTVKGEHFCYDCKRTHDDAERKAGEH